jgi:hypothetical protein
MGAHREGQLAKHSVAMSPIAGVTIEQVADAPWSWLGRGWGDLCAAPRVSVAYCVVFIDLLDSKAPAPGIKILKLNQ